jgi:membrane protein
MSTVILLFSATGVFRHLKDALNVIWSVPPKSKNKVKGFVRDSMVSLLFVMGLGLVLLLLLAVNVAFFSFIRSLGSAMPDLQSVHLWQLFGFALLFLVTIIGFAIVYKVLPDAEISWRDVWAGAVVTSLMFTIGQYVIGLLFSLSSIDTIYGAASALMIILIWVHVSAHILLFGAEFTQVYANKYGSKIVSTVAKNETEGVLSPTSN